MAEQQVEVHKKQEMTEEEPTRPGRMYVPDVDICETKEALWLWVDMPGVDDKSVDVRVEENVLSIDGRVSLAEYENLTPMYTEYNIGNYKRRFTVSQDIDTERIRGQVNNGVLELELPKRERAKPRRIEIAAR